MQKSDPRRIFLFFRTRRENDRRLRRSLPSQFNVAKKCTRTVKHRDVEARLGAARTTFNQMHPLWISTSLSTRAKMKLHEVSVVTIARRGSESWCLTAKARKKSNGWNSRCLVMLTGRTHCEEASTDTTSFDFVATIRHQRLNWLG